MHSLVAQVVDAADMNLFSEGTSAVNDGASELDFVVNVPLLKQRAYGRILEELKALRSAFRGQVTKLILETSQLTDTDVVLGCLLASAANFDFVKTSTGFLGHGATKTHVRLMRMVSDREGKGMQVKASGGIRSAETARAMLRAGATRLGLSGSVAIMNEGSSAGAY